MLGLASCLLTKIPGGKLKGGILSVPHGTSALQLNRECLDICDRSKVSVLEGARNNLPDEASETATRAILEIVDRLGPRDVVITVISGGGSSLLTAPVTGVSLQEKLEVVSLMELGEVKVARPGKGPRAPSRAKSRPGAPRPPKGARGQSTPKQLTMDQVPLDQDPPLLLQTKS